jgi:hypothetical protein
LKDKLFIEFRETSVSTVEEFMEDVWNGWELNEFLLLRFDFKKKTVCRGASIGQGMNGCEPCICRWHLSIYSTES